ncbi:MAG: hypothetical protein ACYC9L_09220 [Sulfuricaulis sp.]
MKLLIAVLENLCVSLATVAGSGGIRAASIGHDVVRHILFQPSVMVF